MQNGEESYFLDVADSIACTHLAAVCSLTESGFGLSLQVGGEVKEKIAQGRLKAVLPEWTLPPVSLYLVTPYRVQSDQNRSRRPYFHRKFRQGSRRMSAENWSVYLILCENGAFYCGISNRPQERFTAHLSGKGAKYTRLNKPVEMRIVSDGLSKSEALKREIGIKKLTAEQKRGLWAEAETLAKD